MYRGIAVHGNAKVKRPTIVLNAWNQLGNCYIVKANYAEALSCYLEAERCFKLHQIPLSGEMLSKVYLNIGKLLLKR